MRARVYLKILFSDIKNNFLIPLSVSVGICILTMMMYNITGLQGRYVAQPLEFMLVFIGAVLLTSVFVPEQNKEVRAVICSKKIDYLFIILIRVLYSAGFMAFLIGAFCVLMQINECEVTLYHFFGGISSALFLGSIGFMVAGIADNVIVGYMCAIIYYICCIGLKNKIGVFNLFSMYGGENSGKGWMLLGSVILISGTFLLLLKKDNNC